MATLKREDFLSIEKNPNGVCTIWMDQKNEKINKIGPDLVELFNEVFSELDQDDSIKAFVLSSKKKDFIAGADIDAFKKVQKKDSDNGKRRMLHYEKVCKHYARGTSCAGTSCGMRK